MADQSAIEWTEATWGPIVGCSRVSEGCRHCYAEREAAGRLSGTPKYQGLARMVNGHASWTGELRLWAPHLDLPLRWKKPRRIFVNSMSDLFHEAVPDEWIDRIFGVMARAWWHQFQVLTKRPERMRAILSRPWRTRVRSASGQWPLPNVWLGVSVEDQATADARIPLLLQTPAAVRWCSYEPALGPMGLARWLLPQSIRGLYAELPLDLSAHHSLNWVVVGGESGPSARPFDLAWARQTIAQGQAAGVQVFVKQIGRGPYTMAEEPLFRSKLLSPRTPLEVAMWWPTDPMRDRKGGDPAEWPEDLRVREYPR